MLMICIPTRRRLPFSARGKKQKKTKKTRVDFARDDGALRRKSEENNKKVERRQEERHAGDTESGRQEE